MPALILRQVHETDLLRSDSAAQFFKAHGITKLLSADALMAEIDALLVGKNARYIEHQEKKRRANELLTVKWEHQPSFAWSAQPAEGGV